jgi:phosphoribosylanthranilate isomerase
MSVAVKICGLNTSAAIEAAAGAAYAGFVFFAPSPRHVLPATAARLARGLPPLVVRVALVVEPSDADLDAILGGFRPDLWQLHGAETPQRVAEIKARTGLPAMKALGISKAEDLAQAAQYLEVADQLLFDAKPPKRPDALPGGNAVSFDWTILAGTILPLPWMLSGGLTAANLATAVRISGAKCVDLSSGVEDRPGHKAPRLIRRFLSAAAEA